MSECDKSSCGQCGAKDDETFEQAFERLFGNKDQEPAAAEPDKDVLSDLRRELRDRACEFRDLRVATQGLFEALVGVSKADSADSKTLIARNAVLEYVFRSLLSDGLLEGLESLRYENGMLDVKWDEEQWVE